MLRRTLASVFLLTLLLSQAITGVCRSRCDLQSATATPSCHAMTMDSNLAFSAPCAPQPCSPNHPLIAEQQSLQPALSTFSTEPLTALTPAIDTYLASPRMESPPGRSLLLRTTPFVSPLKTALRV